MSNGIYPEFIGPTAALQQATLYPAFIQPDFLQEDVGGGGGLRYHRRRGKHWWELEQERARATALRQEREERDLALFAMAAMEVINESSDLS